MIVLVLGLAGAVVTAVLHAILVRRLPRRLRVISLGGFCLVSAALLAAAIVILDIRVTGAQLLVSFILMASLALDYAIVFTGIEADSPTLSIVNEILDRGEGGLPGHAMAEFVRRRPFVQSRIDALVEAGVLADGQILIVRRGGAGRLVQLAEGYRRLCGYRKETG